MEQIIAGILCHMVGKRRSKSKNFATILAYHEICNLPKEINWQHSYNVAPLAFREQMESLKKNNYSIIRLEELIGYIKDKKEMPRKSLVITFDDGYKNNYTNAFHVLKKYNFPATIFLATNYIGTSEVFPWLKDICGGNKKLEENWIPLSWEEVTEMSRDGITFGSHTSSHTNIRQMSKSEFEKEIEKSKDVIERQINKKIKLFSYPFSFPKYRRCYRDLIVETRKVLLLYGFLGACTTIIGTNSLRDDLFCLKRIQIKNTDNLLSFKAKVEGAYNWVGSAQRIYQKMIEPIVEKIQ